jgi:hypothetical protein
VSANIKGAIMAWRKLIRVMALTLIAWHCVGQNLESEKYPNDVWAWVSVARCQASESVGKSDYDASGVRCVVGSGECAGGLR